MAAAARADDRRDGVDRAAPGPGAPRQPASGLQGRIARSAPPPERAAPDS